MKRVILLMISIILIFNIFVINIKESNEGEQYDVEEESNTDRNTIEKTLCGYFSSQLESQKKLRVIKNPYIVPESILEEYNNINSTLMISCYKNIGEKIIWYDVKIKINSIEYGDKFIKVDVDNIVDLQYKNINGTNGYKEHHIIYMHDDNNKNLLIDRDIYNEDLLGDEEIHDIYLESEFEKYLDDKINIKLSELNIQNANISEFNDENYIACQCIRNRKVSRDKKYNGKEAAKWARENANGPEDYKGEDCTNFVSKALKVGGIPQDSIWHNDSVAWVGVLELRKWLLDTGYAVEYNYSYCDEGDVIQFYNSNYDRWSHSVIVTYVNSRYSSGYIYVSAHTNAANNVPLFKYYPTKKYTKMRCLKIIY